MKRVKFLLTLIAMCLSAVSIKAQTDYYRGNSGEVKFNYYHYVSSDYYMGVTTLYDDVIFNVVNNNDARFFLDKIDDTRYLIGYGQEVKYGNYTVRQYMVPAVPETYGGIYGVHCDGRNVSGVFTTVNAFREGDFLYVFDEKIISLQQLTDLLNGNQFKKVDLKSHNDYAYTFPFHEIEGKSYYQIKPEFDKDLLPILGIGGESGYWVYVDDQYLHLRLEGKNNFGRISPFAIIGDETPQTIAVTGISVTPANLLASVGSTTQLTATVTPANATSQAYTWGTSTASVATVSNSGMVTAVAPGTAYIYATLTDETNNRIFADSCLVTVKEQGVIANPNPIRNSRGTFNVSLSIPSEGSFTATFDVTLPPKFALNVGTTKLAEDLAGSYTLKITDKGNGVWSFEIAPNGLRSASTTSFREAVNVAYTVEKTLEDGDYILKINDMILTLSDGTVIRDDEITIPVHFDSATGNETVGEAASVICYGDVLSVNSPPAEQIEVYSVSGALLYRAQKASGKATFRLNHLPKGVLIVKGGSGWVKKVVN